MTIFDYKKFHRDLGEATLLAFLRPYLADQSFFNANKMTINYGVIQFFMQRKTNEEARFTDPILAMIIKAIKKEITPDWEIYSKEKELEVKKQTITLDTLSEHISKTYGQEMLNALYRQSEGIADGPTVEQLSANIYDPKLKNNLLARGQEYKAAYLALAPHRKREAEKYQSQIIQEALNVTTLAWAEHHLTHFELLKEIVKDPQALEAYTAVMGLGNEEYDVKTLSEMIARYNTQKTSAPNTDEPHAELYTIDKKISTLINKMSLDAGAHAFRSLNDHGKPTEKRNLSQRDTVLYGLLLGARATLIVGFVLVNVFTLAPLIPTLAEKALESLYTDIFSGLGFVSPHHQFSIGAIYGLSIAFLAVVDLIIGVGVVHLLDKDKQDTDLKRVTVYPYEMAKETCAYIDKDCEMMDKTVATSDSAPKRVLFTRYAIDHKEADNLKKEFTVKNTSNPLKMSN